MFKFKLFWPLEHYADTGNILSISNFLQTFFNQEMKSDGKYLSVEWCWLNKNFIKGEKLTLCYEQQGEFVEDLCNKREIYHFCAQFALPFYKMGACF